MRITTNTEQEPTLQLSLRDYGDNSIVLEVRDEKDNRQTLIYFTVKDGKLRASLLTLAKFLDLIHTFEDRLSVIDLEA